MRQFTPNCEPELLLQREKTLIYQVDAKFRGDPYPGALAALDYLKCRVGKTYEDRDKNLVLAWGKVTEEDGNLTMIASKGEDSSVSQFIDKILTVRTNDNRCLLGRTFTDLQGCNIQGITCK